ncbi:MAG: hypothetical protein ABIG44_10900 [Planctomycetota bacterium]
MPEQKPRIVRMRVVVLVAAAVISIVAACVTVNVWLHLPGVHISRIDYRMVQQALRSSQGRMSAQAREGQTVANVGSLFTAVQRAPEVYEAQRGVLQNMVGSLGHTQLGRLQLAAFLLRDLEQRDRPPAEWWPVIAPVLEGLEQVSFAHFLPELIEYRADVMANEPINLGPGAACVYAQTTLGHPHGPWLQFLAARLDQLAAERRDLPDGSAELCQLVNWRLLRQWVLEPGPASQRLMAAELLAESLNKWAATGQPVTALDLAQELRTWRANYHVGAMLSKHLSGGTVPLISLSVGPKTSPDDYRRLVNSVAALVWFSAAALTAALLTLLGLPWCLKAVLTTPGKNIGTLINLITAVIALIAIYPAGLNLIGFDQAIDLRRMASSELGWPRLPLIAAGVTLIIVVGSGLGHRGAAVPRGIWRVRMTFTAAIMWLAFGVVVLAAAGFTKYTQQKYDTALVATHQAGEVEAMQIGELSGLGGQPADHALDALRQWDPREVLARH